MFWRLGNINIKYLNPKVINDEDYPRFFLWMKNRGWKIDRQDLDPMSTDYSVRNPDNDKSWNNDINLWEQEENIPYHIIKIHNEFHTMEKEHSIPNCENCIHHESCWKDIEHRKPTTHPNGNVEWTHISLPWIGKMYNKHRIAVIGINPYEAGGKNFYPLLIEQAKHDLGTGKIKLNFGHKSYSGTILWHRIALYTKQILDSKEDQETVNFLLSDIPIQNAYDYVAFTNSIKCSPMGERSIPSLNMWKNCSNILNKELEILSPKMIFIIGKGDNLFFFLNQVVESYQLIEKTKYVDLYEVLLHGEKKIVISFPHPSAPSMGGDHQIGRDLDQFLNKYNLHKYI